MMYENYRMLCDFIESQFRKKNEKSDRYVSTLVFVCECVLY